MRFSPNNKTILKPTLRLIRMYDDPKCKNPRSYATVFLQKAKGNKVELAKDIYNLIRGKEYNSDLEPLEKQLLFDPWK